MLRRVNKENEGTTFLNTKTCYLLIWANKQLGNPISKDVLKFICKRFLIYFYYVKYCFYVKFSTCYWNSTYRVLFSSILAKRVNTLESNNKAEADMFVFALSCSLIACNYPVRIVWFENGQPYIMTLDIASKMGLDYITASLQIIEREKSMKVWTEHEYSKQYKAQERWSKPLLCWHAIENYKQRIRSKEDYVIFYGCEMIDNIKYLRTMQTNPCHGMLFVSIK